MVGEESWDGELRTVVCVKELHDVTVATYGAYPEASVELRTRNGGEGGLSVGTAPSLAPAAGDNVDNETARRRQEDRMSEDRQPTNGGLSVEDRVEARPRRGLAQAFREQGFPAETATVEWGEFRAATFSGSLNGLSPVRQSGVDLGADQATPGLRFRRSRSMPVTPACKCCARRPGRCRPPPASCAQSTP